MRCFLRVLRSPGLICSLALLLGGLPARAEVKLPHLISHNMVLQQGRKVAIWGWADPQESVQVSFRGQKVATATGADGRWKVYLQPLKAGGPDELTISGKNTITIRNVLVGEVWVCSGQSNMEMPIAKTQPWYTGIANFEAEIESAYHPQLRMFTVKTTVASRPQEDAEGQWMESSPATAG